MKHYKGRLEKLEPYVQQTNSALKLLNLRYGNIDLPEYSLDSLDGTNDMAGRLKAAGGFAQQRRMIRDKRKSLDKALLYSYQAAFVRKWIPDNEMENLEGEECIPPVRALINPNKLKFDYDEKIISTGFENGFHPGDVFEWCNTGTYWLICLQELNELAYFRAEIRRCTNEIKFPNEDGVLETVKVAVRGPVETKINFIAKHGLSIDTPNHSLNIYMPKTSATMHYFKRYAKFYLKSADSPDDIICWRIEATDSISTPGILEINAVEYYSNKQKDDVQNGVVDAFVVEPIDPTPVADNEIIFIAGETFIKPKKEYVYTIGKFLQGKWTIGGDGKAPVKLEEFLDENNFSCVKIKWLSTYSGQFDLFFCDSKQEYKKTIVVESLF